MHLIVCLSGWLWEADGNYKDAKAIRSHHLAPSLLEVLDLSPKIDLDENSQILCCREKEKKKKEKKVPSPWDTFDGNRKMQVKAIA